MLISVELTSKPYGRNPFRHRRFRRHRPNGCIFRASALIWSKFYLVVCIVLILFPSSHSIREHSKRGILECTRDTHDVHIDGFAGYGFRGSMEEYSKLMLWMNWRLFTSASRAECQCPVSSNVII